MRLSTVSIALCFALAPFAARAMVQHRDVLHQLQRKAIPITAAALVPAVKLDDESDGRRAIAKSAIAAA
jgi:hypothetical protein